MQYKLVSHFSKLQRSCCVLILGGILRPLFFLTNNLLLTLPGLGGQITALGQNLLLRFVLRFDDVMFFQDLRETVFQRFGGGGNWGVGNPFKNLPKSGRDPKNGENRNSNFKNSNTKMIEVTVPSRGFLTTVWWWWGSSVSDFPRGGIELQNFGSRCG